MSLLTAVVSTLARRRGAARSVNRPARRSCWRSAVGANPRPRSGSQPASRTRRRPASRALSRPLHASSRRCHEAPGPLRGRCNGRLAAVRIGEQRPSVMSVVVVALATLVPDGWRPGYGGTRTNDQANPSVDGPDGVPCRRPRGVQQLGWHDHVELRDDHLEPGGVDRHGHRELVRRGQLVRHDDRVVVAERPGVPRRVLTSRSRAVTACDTDHTRRSPWFRRGLRCVTCGCDADGAERWRRETCSARHCPRLR
jgi:hypothetical protein